VAVVAIRFVLGLLDIEVITPTGEFESIVVKRFGLPGKDIEGEVGPLAGEQGNGA
jgi:hypothetical protein